MQQRQWCCQYASQSPMLHQHDKIALHGVSNRNMPIGSLSNNQKAFHLFQQAHKTMDPTFSTYQTVSKTSSQKSTGIYLLKGIPLSLSHTTFFLSFQSQIWPYLREVHISTEGMIKIQLPYSTWAPHRLHICPKLHNAQNIISARRSVSLLSGLGLAVRWNVLLCADSRQYYLWKGGPNIIISTIENVEYVASDRPSDTAQATRTTQVDKPVCT